MSTGYIRVYMQERTMEFIYTTLSTAEKLKRLAKSLRKSTKSSLAVALDAVARQHGYAHWKHVTVCLEQTAGTGHSQQSLPSSLVDILDRAAASDPASAGTQQAFGHGFVFAMDVKDADELSLPSDFEECDEGWYIAARDLWRALVHYRDEETGTTLFEAQSPEDLAETALDDCSTTGFSATWAATFRPPLKMPAGWFTGCRSFRPLTSGSAGNSSTSANCPKSRWTVK